MKTIEVKHKDKFFTVICDDTDHDKLLKMNLKIIVARNQPFVLDITDWKNPVVVQRILLNYPKERISFKDGNKLNLQKDNLELVTKEFQRKAKNKYTREHRNKEKEYERYLKNKDKQKEYQKKSRQLNRDKYRKDRARVKVRYKRGFYEVKRTGKREIDISFEDYQEIMKELKCHYCTTDISLEIGFGLDRRDNSRGYFKDNVVPCCGICNRTKGDRFNYEEFKVMTDALVKYRVENKR